MIASKKKVDITLRIPGNWEHPKLLLEQMPAEYRLQPDHIELPDGSQIAMDMVPRDDQFGQIFASSCRTSPTLAERKIVDSYQVNVLLTGTGGSQQDAATMMEAGAAFIKAGAGGVFIDNSGLAHGGEMWQQMTDDGGPDALSFAYVSIVGGKQDLWTMGMHILGRPELMMSRGAEQATDEETLVEMIRYLCATDREFAEGHVIADENGPRFVAQPNLDQGLEAGSPMHNPWGRFKLVSMREIGESN